MVRISRSLLFMAALLMAAPGCGKDGGGDEAAPAAGEEGAAKSAAKAAPKAKAKAKVVDTLISAEEAGALLGKFKSEEGKYYAMEIKSDKIKCNHSNHSNEFKSHKYSLARAMDGEYLLIAKGGHMKVSKDDEDSWKFDAEGICPWGINNPYKKTEDHSGDIGVGINAALLEGSEGKDGTVGEAIALPWGSLSVEKVERKKWKDDDGSKYVVSIKMVVENSSSQFIDALLPNHAEDSFDEGFAHVDCDGNESEGYGNPEYKKHKSPAFLEGGGWSSLYAPIGPSKKRKGYLSMLMGSEEENASGSCTITFNTVALGGPLVTYKVDL